MPKKKKTAKGYKKRKRKQQLYTRGKRIYKQLYTRVIIVKYNFATSNKKVIDLHLMLG